MEITFTYIKLLKFNLEYLIKCLEELESITKFSSLLKSRASDIVDYSIESFFKKYPPRKSKLDNGSNQNFYTILS